MSISLPGGWYETGHGNLIIYIQDVRASYRERKKIKLTAKPWNEIKDIKEKLRIIFNIPVSHQLLFYYGQNLKNSRNLAECGIWKDNITLYFSISHKHIKDRHINHYIHPYGVASHLSLRKSFIKTLYQAQKGLELGLAPELAMDGTGGTYFLKDTKQQNVGCFKPLDEEPYAPKNPRGIVGRLGKPGFRRGILSGEACEREVIAYLLDKDHFSGVPATAFVEALHPVFNYGGDKIDFKVGSFQEFVRHDDVASDISPSKFSLHEVHKIAILDIRLLNTDRNDANILVKRKRSRTKEGTMFTDYELVPIDHGYCLPSSLDVKPFNIKIGWCDWCWYNWPQLKLPLSDEDKKYVLSINPEEDIKLLESHQVAIRKECLRSMTIACLMLKKAITFDLTLFDVAKFMCRDDLDSPSILERLYEKAISITRANVETPTWNTPKANEFNKRWSNVLEKSHFSFPSTSNEESLLESNFFSDSLMSSLHFLSQPLSNEQENQKDMNIQVHSNETPGKNDIKNKLYIDTSSIDNTTNLNYIKNNNEINKNEIHSPPGFWASYAPFTYKNNNDSNFNEIISDDVYHMDEKRLSISSDTSTYSNNNKINNEWIETMLQVPSKYKLFIKIINNLIDETLEKYKIYEEKKLTHLLNGSKT